MQITEWRSVFEGQGNLVVAGLLSLALHVAVLVGMPSGGVDSNTPLQVSRDGSRRMDVDLGRNSPRSSVADPLAFGEVPEDKLRHVVAISEKSTGWVATGFLGPPYPPAEPLYFSPEMLDSPPYALERLEMPLPEGNDPYVMRRMQVTLLISSSGKVDEVIVESSNLASVDEAALIARFREIRFRAGVREGHPAPSRARVKLEGTLSRLGASKAGATLAAENR